MKIAEIKIPDRCRKHLGDIEALAKSISEVGVLHPVVVNGDGVLVAGQRRLKAVELLGWDDVPATVAKNLADAVLLLKAERDENVCRLELARSEAVIMGRRLWALEKPNADARKAEGQKAGGRGHKKLGGKLPASLAETRELVGAGVGLSGKSYEKAEAVVAKAEADPKHYGDLREQMDRDGKIEKAYRAVKKREAEAKRDAELANVVLPGEPLIVGDFRALADAVPDDSLDLIFTDPPYARTSVSLYDDLGRFAAAKLANGGSLISYCGQCLLPKALELLSEHLRYWWVLACLHSGSKKTVMREYGINAHWKPMLWFVKGTRADKNAFVQDTVTGGREKDDHQWQQAESEAAYYIDLLCSKKGIVCDPFLGSGTTAAAAIHLQRRWIGFEIDEKTAKVAAQRLDL